MTYCSPFYLFILGSKVASGSVQALLLALLLKITLGGVVGNGIGYLRTNWWASYNTSTQSTLLSLEVLDLSS